MQVMLISWYKLMVEWQSITLWETGILLEEPEWSSNLLWKGLQMWFLLLLCLAHVRATRFALKMIVTRPVCLPFTANYKCNNIWHEVPIFNRTGNIRFSSLLMHQYSWNVHNVKNIKSRSFWYRRCSACSCLQVEQQYKIQVANAMC